MIKIADFIGKMFNSIFDAREIERELSKASDHADLERRIQKLQRQGKI